MKLEIVNPEENRGTGVTCLHVTQDEAIALIQSLTNQILEKSPNSGRLETKLDDGSYFTVAVTTRFESTRELTAAFEEFLRKEK